MNPSDTTGDDPADHLTAGALQVVADLLKQAGETHYIPLRGNSMLPLIRDGDQVLVIACDNNIQVGEIVVIQRDHEWLAHRVLRVERGGLDHLWLYTKGDHINRLDAPMSAELLVGKVLAVRRGGRQLRLDTQAWQPLGKLLAGVMRVEARLYRLVAGESGSDREKWRVVMILNRGMVFLNSLLIHSSQAIAGHWQD